VSAGREACFLALALATGHGSETAEWGII
jgi:hypothetical protein